MHCVMTTVENQIQINSDYSDQSRDQFWATMCTTRTVHLLEKMSNQGTCFEHFDDRPGHPVH